MSAQSTKEVEDLAIHTILDEIHDEYDGMEDRPTSLGGSLSRIISDSHQFRNLAGATAREERAYVLEFAARLVRHVELVDLLAENS